MKPDERKIMKIIVYGLLFTIIFKSVYTFVYWAQPREIKYSLYMHDLPNMIAIVTGVFFIWASRKQETKKSLLLSIILGGLLGGSITFFIFFFGPLIVLKSGQGPIMGVFLAPYGVVLGALIGLTYWFSYRQKNTYSRHNFISITILISIIFIIASIFTLVNG